MSVIENYNYINSSIKLLSKKLTLIVVTKNQQIDKINLLINSNHFDFGENRVQEASLKWKRLILDNTKLKLHLIGKLQSNKAKDAFELFHYIHTLDNEKLAQIFSNPKYSKNKILDVIKYNLISLNWKIITCALGGINFKNYRKIKCTKSNQVGFIRAIKNPSALCADG